MLSESASLAVARTSNWNTQVLRHAQEIPDAPAFVTEDSVMTWAEVALAVERVGAGLSRAGVGRGDRVMLLMTNRPEFMVCLLAINRLGAVVVPVNWRQTVEELSYIASDAGTHVVMFDGPLSEKAEGLAEAVADIALFGLQSTVAGVPVTDIETLISGEGGPTDVPPLEIAELALIMYTAGTTGRPKGAMLSHGNMQSVVPTLMRMWRMGAEQVTNLVGTPLFHIGALGTVPAMIMTGSTSVFPPAGPFDPPTMLDTLARHQVTSLFLVPAQWALLSAAQLEQPRQLALTTLMWGGEPASVALLERMGNVFPGAQIVGCFGQTETTGIAVNIFHEDAKRNPGSVGKPVSPTAVRVVDANMDDVAVGDVGEIVYRGPGVTLGYWNRPEATEEAFAGGWFHSGDLVRRDERGFIYVVDRVKDMIISGGENIYSAEIERVLAKHPKVFTIAVVGAPHPKWGETPVAFVEPRDPADPPTLEELVEWSRDQLSSFKRPSRLVIGSLPRSSVGKILKTELRQHAADPSAAGQL